MRFPGGKFRGHRIMDVPSSYLIWSLENSYWESHHKEIREELHYRLGFHAAADLPPTQPAMPRELQPEAAELIEAGFRVLALKRHPDQGGDGPAMRRLIEVRAILREVVKR